MIIGLATPAVASTLDEGIEKVLWLQSEASAKGAQLVCFPEAYLPGLRGQDFEVHEFGTIEEERVVKAVAESSRALRIATILGMETMTDNGRAILSLVIDANGHLLGFQTKNQLDPTEEQYYEPGTTRSVFEINGVRFGIVICHEGWRYPETVRWAAIRGAKIVFHPQHTGNNRQGIRLTEWGSPQAPYYEKAMMCRSLENSIYFASVNYALRFQESATTLIDPSGRCQAYLPYGEEGVLVEEINAEKATGLFARRYAPERNLEQPWLTEENI